MNNIIKAACTAGQLEAPTYLSSPGLKAPFRCE